MKIPVIDSWGNQIGEFIPSGGGACLGYALLGMLMFMLSPCFTPVMFTVLIGFLIWKVAQTRDESSRMGWIILLILVALLGALWTVGIASFYLYVNFDAMFGRYF